MRKPWERRPQVKELDFSEFHALDHWPASRYCFTQYGGPRIHLRYWWEYKGSVWVRKQTLCRIGHHRYSQGWQRPDPNSDPMDETSWVTFWTCTYCWKPQPDPDRS